MDDLTRRGLKVVSQLEENEDNPDTFDIVIVHGLHGSFDKDWSESLSSDEDFNFVIRRSFRLLAYDHDMSLSSRQSILEELAFQKLALSLLEEIAKEAVKERPIVFLCHNLGGVLVKEMLWIANHDSQYIDIAVATRALILFGTPCIESDWDNVMVNLILATTEANVTKDPNVRQADLHSLFRKGSSVLKAASSRFEMLAQQYKVISLFEDVPTAGIGIVVPPSSDHDRSHLIQASHSGLCSLNADVLSNVMTETTDVRRTPKKEYEQAAVTFRQKLASLWEYDDSPSRISAGPYSSTAPSWFNEFLQRGLGISYVYGSAGAGKTVFASRVSKADCFNSEKHVVLAFCFDTSDYRRRSYRDLLGYFLLQLLYGTDTATESTYVRSLCQKVEGVSSLSSFDLWRIFFAMVNWMSTKNIVCIIDALDECEPRYLQQLLGDFKRLVSLCRTRCTVFITFQPTTAIQDLAGPLDDRNSLNLDEVMGQDRKILIQESLGDKKFETLRKELEQGNCTPLATRLLSHLDYNKGLGDPRSMSYDEIYRKILVQIDVPQLWLRDVLVCTAFAERPMTVSELAFAMGIPDLDQISGEQVTLQKIRITAPKQLEEDLELAMRPLMQVESGIVRLIHSTFRAFIRHYLNKKLMPEVRFGLPSETATWHLVMLRKCMLTLCLPELRDGCNEIPSPRPFRSLCAHPATPLTESFAVYANSMWPRHLLTTQEVLKDSGGQPELIANCLSCFWNNGAITSWWARSFKPSQGYFIPKTDAGSVSLALHLMISLGLMAFIPPPSLESIASSDFKSAISASIDLDDIGTTVDLLLRAADVRFDLWLSAVKECCKNGQLAILSAIIKRQGKQLSKDKIQECLEITAEYGNWPLASQLMAHASQSNELPHNKVLADIIVVAAHYGHDGVVFELLRATSDPDCQDEGPETSSAKLTRELVVSDNGPQNIEDHDCVDGRGSFRTKTTPEEDDNQGAIEAPEPEKMDQEGTSTKTSWLSEALFSAAEFGSEAVVRILLEHGAQHISRDLELNWTPLHAAAYKGNSEAVEQLLDHDADLEDTDYQDATPLMLACLGDFPHTAQALLARGSDPDHIAYKSCKYRAIHIAARNGNVDLVRLLLESGASENVRLGAPEHSTPLHIAVAWADEGRKHADVVRILCQFGSDVNAAAQEGSTAMHMAVQNAACDKNMVQALLRYGADIDRKDDKGFSPLYYAVKNKREQLAKYLWNPWDSRGLRNISVLFHAAATGRLIRVQQLLAAGEDTKKKDAWGRIALDVAVTEEVRRELCKSENVDEKLLSDQAEVSMASSETSCAFLKQRHTKENVDLVEWNCDNCNRLLDGVMFYHCYDCSEDCSTENTWDLCDGCFSASNCKENGHKVMKRFVGNYLVTYEELSKDSACFN